jgi:molecular chaperone HscB
LSCHTIFPAASQLSHFDRLGLPERFDIDRKDLDRKYLAWSRELHPDYFQAKSPVEQSQSLSLSAALNDAYATLKDPYRRAEYLLRLWGGTSASEHRAMPLGFLEEVLELRMEIEEAKEEGSLDPPRARELHDRITNEREASMAAIASALQQWQSAESKRTADGLASIRERLNTVKYYDGLLRELASVEPR